MILLSRRARVLMTMGIAVLMLSADVSPSAETAKATTVSEAAEKQAYREKRFLLRAVDEMDKSLKYVKETAGVLEKQIDAIALLEPRRREDDLWDFMKWYQGYALWLRGQAADFEADLARAFSDDRERSLWIDRYGDLADGYARLAKGLTEKVYRLEDDRKRFEERIRNRRDRLDDLRKRSELDNTGKDDSEEHQGPDEDSSDDRRGKGKEKRDDAKILRLESEIRGLAELLHHLDVLVEVGKAEQEWLSRKETDSVALSRVALVLGSNDPDLIEDAYNHVITTYEADLSSLRSSMEDIDRKRSNIPPVGTLRTLDRAEELSEYYKQLKSNYEQHIAWLSVQIDSYRAELAELGKDR